MNQQSPPMGGNGWGNNGPSGLMNMNQQSPQMGSNWGPNNFNMQQMN